jgi:MFS family permease
MVVELVAGRVIARHVGQSLYTWTSIIGVVLGGITLGNLIGGRLADRFPPSRCLAVLFAAAAGACLAIPYLNDGFGARGWLDVAAIESWPQRIALHVALVFGLPAAVLGLIGPVVAKMALDLGLEHGRTVGNVYAWGALGSIAGTFAAGFFLIQFVGTEAIIFGVAGVLGAVGAALAARGALRPAR